MLDPLTAASRLALETHSSWRGPSLLVLQNDGWADRHPLSGYYFREARHLSVVRLTLFDEPPLLCSLASPRPHRLETTFLYPPVTSRRGGGTGSGGEAVRHGVLTRGIDLRVAFRVRPATLEIEAALTSRWQETVRVDVAWQVEADFADLIEALDDEDAAPVVSIEERLGGLLIGSRRGDLELATRIESRDEQRWTLDGSRLRTSIDLRNQRTEHLRLRVVPIDDDDPIDDEGAREREEALAGWLARRTVVGGEDSRLASLTNRASADLGSLALLDGPAAEWMTPAAGIPLYPALFGRDALTAGWQAAVFDAGEQLAAAHDRTCRLLGTELEPWRDEAPGRILQQQRRGPLARLGDTPFDRYYGDVASPLMFLISFGQLYAWSGERDLVARHWDSAREVLDWTRRADLDGDGYLEYRTESPHGPKHQAWKDSDNAVVNERGRQVDPPIAACEVQGYWFAALQIMAVMAWVMKERREALRLWREARALKKRFNRDFWLDEDGFLAMGLDSDKRPLRVPSSNAAQCITTGIVDAEKIPRLVARMFEPDLFSGWGIRTLGSGNPAYNPLSYHLGSVWPAENASILFGLRRYGFDGETLHLARSLLDLAHLWRDGRVPECVGGYARDAAEHPGAYPHANAPQAWNQSVLPILIQSLLGLQPLAPLRTLAVAPILPEWLPSIELRRLRVGRSEVDLRFWRDRRGRSRHEVLRRKGKKLRVVRQPPLDDLTAGVWDRLGAVARGLVKRK